MQNDVFGKLGAKPRYISQKLRAGLIDIHAHMVDTVDYHIIEGLFQGRLIHIMLILTDADGFGIDFDQF